MRTLNKDINIFVACHKDFYVPNNKYIIPIQVGADNAKTKLDMIGDNTGDNISTLNQSFCELTAQYWAWKNVDCEYYGFFHYRRYLSFDDKAANLTTISNINFDNITDDVIKQIQLEETHMKNLIENYDIILPKRAITMPYTQYKESAQHDIKDLDETIKIIHELYPEFDKYVKKGLFGNYTYFLNMYIMKKKYFFEYMEWLFPILNKFHGQKDYSNLSTYTIRTPGLLAERLLTVYMLYLKDKYKDLQVLELQHTFFDDCTNPYLEPQNKNKIGICFASDDNYIKHLGVAIESLIENSSKNNFYDLIIFDNRISYNNKELLLRNICDKSNFSLRFIKTSDFIANKKLFARNHVNISTYLRFAILDLLRNYSKVIYLDCDIIINKDIASLYEKDLTGKFVGAVRDSEMAYWNKSEEQRNYNKNIIGLKNVYDYFNAGVMIFNVEEMRKHVTTEDLFKIATERVYTLQDQDVLNKICNGKVLFLEDNWNFMANRNLEFNQLMAFSSPKFASDRFLNAKANPYIIHYAGHTQPMYVKDTNYSDLYWKYARNSLFYEEILGEMFGNKQQPHKLKLKTRIKQKLIKIFPKGTKRGTFARKVYYFLKRF